MNETDFPGALTDADIAAMMPDALAEVGDDTQTLPVVPASHEPMPMFCGLQQGSEICDRIAGHPGEHSWHSDIVLNMMAVQVVYLYNTIKVIVDSVPPGMIPGLS